MIKTITTVTQRICIACLITFSFVLMLSNVGFIPSSEITPIILRYIPAANLGFLIILIFFSIPPTTITQVEFATYSLIITGWFYHFWLTLTKLFPLVGYGKNQIIGFAQYVGRPLQADVVLMFCLFFSIIVIGLALLYRNHFLYRRHKKINGRIHFVSLIIFILIIIISSFTLTYVK